MKARSMRKRTKAIIVAACCAAALGGIAAIVFEVGSELPHTLWLCVSGQDAHGRPLRIDVAHEFDGERDPWLDVLEDTDDASGTATHYIAHRTDHGPAQWALQLIGRDDETGEILGRYRVVESRAPSPGCKWQRLEYDPTWNVEQLSDEDER